MNTIKVTLDKDTPLFTMIPFEDFIFNEFRLCVNGIEGILLCYEIKWRKEEKAIVFDYYENNKKIGRYQAFMVLDDMTMRYSVYKCPPCPSFPHNPWFYECEKEIAKDAARIIMFYMGFIMAYPRTHKQERISSHKYSHEHRVSTTQNKIYLFDDIVKYVSEKYVPESGHYKVTCPCWEVRGHYRHYKSGKVIFVPAYRKGKDRKTAKPKDKEYYV